jgi:hypothetical protein
MSFYYSDNPVADAERYLAQQDREAEKFPVCAYCDEPITDEKLFDLDGELYHISCFVSEYQKNTEDYIE